MQRVVGHQPGHQQRGHERETERDGGRSQREDLGELGLGHLSGGVVPPREGLKGIGHRHRSISLATAKSSLTMATPDIGDGRYSTSSWVSSMNASSNDAVTGVSSWTRRPWWVARSPICGAVSPLTVNDPPPSSLPTVAPAPPSAVVNAARSGVTSLTPPPPLRATKSATLVSAISRPRPITTSRSAVSDISLIRWLDTSTVRPSAARPRRKWRTHRMPSGSRPLTGSSNSKTRGSPSRAPAIPSRWVIPSEYLPARWLAAEV